MHVYSLYKTVLKAIKGDQSALFAWENSFQSDFDKKPILSQPFANPGLTQPKILCFTTKYQNPTKLMA